MSIQEIVWVTEIATAKHLVASLPMLMQRFATKFKYFHKAYFYYTFVCVHNYDIFVSLWSFYQHQW